jgi:hypothetical protein
MRASCLVLLTVTTFLCAAPPKPKATGFASPVVYGTTMLIISGKVGVAAVVFTDASGKGATYKFRYESADGKTRKEGTGKVSERYVAGKYAGGDLDVKAGPLEVKWSVGGDKQGWVYYDPAALTVQMGSRDMFDDRAVEFKGKAIVIKKLDLKPFIRK